MQSSQALCRIPSVGVAMAIPLHCLQTVLIPSPRARIGYVHFAYDPFWHSSNFLLYVVSREVNNRLTGWAFAHPVS